MAAGRFAPSPTSDLHLGNLRTALVAWLSARSTGRAFHVRIEDLDHQRVIAARGVAARQLADLAALGLDWDGEVVVQSDRTEAYAAAVARLDTYECFCTRREIAEAARAPHPTRADGTRPLDSLRPYPGTCRALGRSERARLRAVRAPAMRVRAGAAVASVRDLWHGDVMGVVDDFVVRRNDGVYAYNLAVVVDDGWQGVDQVVRGDDLLTSAPRQAWLATRLGLDVPTYGHVPLAVSTTGERLAKRDGAVTLADLAGHGLGPAQVLGLLAESLGLAGAGEPVTPPTLLTRWDPAALPRSPWVVPTLT